MYEVWSNPAAWSTAQWMAVCIMAFVIVAILVMIHRILTIFQMSNKQKYKPNLRRLRNAGTGSTRPSRDNVESGE